MTILLLIICVLLAGIIGLMTVEIRRINRELSYINTHETNAEVTTNTGWPLFTKLAQAINMSLVRTRKSKVEQIEQEKQIKQMLTNLTHDIKTPLTVAIGYSQLLLKDPADPHRKQTQRIENNLLEVNYYLHYLMDFNLLQEKNTQLSISKVDVSKTLEQVLFDYYDELNAKGLQVAVNIKPAVNIRTDKTLLERIFQNLISNLLKYADKQVIISLQDKDPAHFQIVFKNQTTKPFKPSSGLTSRFVTEDSRSANQSIGLGLDIVKSLVTTLGGQFSVSDEAGYFAAVMTFRYRKLEAKKA